MGIGTSAYYDWKKRPGKLISAATLHLYRRMKALFKQSRDSLGSREMKKKLREEGFTIGRYKVRKLMEKLKLIVKQRIAYKVTTKRNERDAVVDNLRQPPRGLVFHSDRGSQYTSKRHRKLLKAYGARSSMGDVGACWDNAVVERFFGSLKHDWIFKIAQPAREHMRKDVAAYMRYYNLDRLHTANGDQSPINDEKSLKKVSG